MTKPSDDQYQTDDSINQVDDSPAPPLPTQVFKAAQTKSDALNAPNKSRIIRASILQVVLLTTGFVLCLPFVWMILTSLKEAGETNDESWMPAIFQWGNYADVFEKIAFAKYYLNSIFVTLWTVLISVVSSAMGAYAFSRLQWYGRDKVFLLYLGTMMLPGLAMMIPSYQIMIALNLVDTYTGLIVGACFSPFGCFLLRQFMMGIPKSLDEAAEMDGASKWQVFWDVIMPMTRPGIITLTIFTFLGSMGSFFWPLVMLRTEELYTLPIGLLFFSSSRTGGTNLMMAAVAMSVIPMIIVFIVLQKHLIKGIQLGGVKG